jgi:hypothetical protein
MTDFLGDAWFDQLEATISSLTVGERDEPGLALGQVINGTPYGSVNYTIYLGSGRAGSIERDSVAGARVTLVEDYESALGIVSGASVTDLLSTGKIKIRGDVNALLSAASELATLAEALSPNT